MEATNAGCHRVTEKSVVFYALYMLHSQTYTVAADRAKLYTTSHSTQTGYRVGNGALYRGNLDGDEALRVAPC